MSSTEATLSRYALLTSNTQIVNATQFSLWDSLAETFYAIQVVESTLLFDGDQVAMEDDATSTLRRAAITLHDSAGDGDYVLTATNAGLFVNTNKVPSTLSITGILNYPSIPANGFSDLAIALTGAEPGDTVCLGVPSISITADVIYLAWVSASNTVTVRAMNTSSSTARDPLSGQFRVTILKV